MGVKMLKDFVLGKDEFIKFWLQPENKDFQVVEMLGQVCHYLLGG